ncbi:MAG TPA: RidA family protein [Steroidobacteraceae bacterium]|nr:RidA family protein [Steroidobacteraceae bacterium]
MTIKRIQVGPRMSQAVVHGNVVYLAGQVCPDKGATTVGAQTKVILQQIDKLLAEAGTSKQNLLSATIWLTDMGRFAEMNEVWDKWVAPGATPARATVEARLAGPQYLIEIAAIAAI